ncbi:MAG: peroxide stress protein YaaA, partial [Akkermansiaceae bacterium]|nr:peroxide stress protein YaaA [Akkermansiaceae bacterium]
MLYLLSPAKSLDYESEAPSVRATMPRFLDHSAQLADRLKTMKPAELEVLMGISSKLAELNAGRFDEWRKDYSKPEARQAILAFTGDVYQGLSVEDWDKDDFVEAQKSIRILSGLYGILRPLDLMLPYRLEMGTKLPNERGANLYQFWGSLLTDSLNKEIKGAGDAVINLASNEYFSSVQAKNLKSPVITPVFKDWKNGQYKIISFYAKKARGMMASWAIQQRISSPAGLKRFKAGGYAYDKSLSD